MFSKIHKCPHERKPFKFGNNFAPENGSFDNLGCDVFSIFIVI